MIRPAIRTSPRRHLRRRGGDGPQPTTTAELLFDLVFVFAITQLSHLILGDLSLDGLARSAFLLIVIWWAWIYTAWMTNWFDPDSGAVLAVLGGVMLAGLVAAAALPAAFGADALLFALSYVALQVGRNTAAVLLLERQHRLRRVFERLVVWSTASGMLWILGALVGDGARISFWIAAFALDLLAPLAGYWLPGRGRAATGDYDIEAGHFAERCGLFVLIALGESIVIAGGTAADEGLTAGAVGRLVVAFLGTLALWALYFGPGGERSRRAVLAGEDTGRLARDAYTYVHIPIVAGIVLTAAADHLLITEPGASARGLSAVLFIGGPVLFLTGTCLFRWIAAGGPDVRRLVAAGALLALVPLNAHLTVLLSGAIVTALLCALLAWELPHASRSPLLAPTTGDSGPIDAAID